LIDESSAIINMKIKLQAETVILISDKSTEGEGKGALLISNLYPGRNLSILLRNVCLSDLCSERCEIRNDYSQRRGIIYSGEAGEEMR